MEQRYSLDRDGMHVILKAGDDSTVLIITVRGSLDEPETSIVLRDAEVSNLVALLARLPYVLDDVRVAVHDLGERWTRRQAELPF